MTCPTERRPAVACTHAIAARARRIPAWAATVGTTIPFAYILLPLHTHLRCRRLTSPAIRFILGTLSM